MRQPFNEAQGARLGSQHWKRRGCIQLFRMIVRGVSLFQRACPQPARQLRVVRFPPEMFMGEWARAPQMLVLKQETVELLKALGQLGMGKGV